MISVDEGGFSTEKCLECPLPNAEGNTVHPSWQPVLNEKMKDFDERHKVQPQPEKQVSSATVQPSLPAAPTGMKFEDAVNMAVAWLKAAPMPPSRKAYTALDKAIKSLEKSLE
jgi:hypothetical protein